MVKYKQSTFTSNTNIVVVFVVPLVELVKTDRQEGLHPTKLSNKRQQEDDKTDSHDPLGERA